MILPFYYMKPANLFVTTLFGFRQLFLKNLNSDKWSMGLGQMGNDKKWIGNEVNLMRYFGLHQKHCSYTHSVSYNNKNLISFISFHKKADAPQDKTIETMDIILLIDHRKSRSYPLFSRQILSMKNWEALILPFLVTLQESLKFLTILYS